MKIHVRARGHSETNGGEKKSVPHDDGKTKMQREFPLLLIWRKAYTQLRSGRHRQSNAQRSLPPISFTNTLRGLRCADELFYN